MKKNYLYTAVICLALSFSANAQPKNIQDFDQNWTFNLGDVPSAKNVDFNDSGWRKLNLPHDWSIEGQFSKGNPAKPRLLLMD